MTQLTLPAERAAATNIRWLVFALACSTSWLFTLHRYTFGLIKPDLMREWKLSEGEIGLIDSGFAVFYSAFQFPAGIAADIFGVRLVLTVLILVWSVGLAMHAWAPSKTEIWYARAMLGLGQSGVLAALNRIARQWFPPSIRTSLQGLAGITAGRLGGLSANVLFLTVLIGYCGLDWRTAIYLFAVLGLAQAITFVAVFRNSPRQHPWVNESEAALIAGSSTIQPAKMTLRELFRDLSLASLVNFIALNVQTILSTFADNIFSNWLPLFLFAVHQLKAKEMGIYSALPLLGGAIGGALGGVLNDVLIKHTGNRCLARRTVAVAGKGLAAVLIIVALAWYDEPYLFCGALFFVKFFSDWSLTTAWGVATDVGGRATASVFAFNNAVAGVGSIGAPAVIGYVIQYSGWPTVFVVIGVTYALCALSWLLIDCTLPLVASED
jgi:MFS transporter, ACS family, glucarate transporter